MKIAIVDDDPRYQDIFEKILTTAGHTVLKATVLGRPIILDIHIAKEVRTFNPDLVFIDEDMGRYVIGERFAKQLDFPKEKLVGISSSFKQGYCSKHFPWKNDLLLSNQKAKERAVELLALIK